MSPTPAAVTAPHDAAPRFHPAGTRLLRIPGCPFIPGKHWLIGAVGHTRVAQQFSIDVMVQAYQSLYDRLLAGSAVRSSTQLG